MKKSFIVLLALVLIVGIAVGGTVAWLTATSDKVTNTFTVGDVKIELIETKKPDGTEVAAGVTDWKAQMIPGYTYSKNPKVTVKANSVDCYLFVKFEVTGTATALEYTSNLTVESEKWTKLTGVDGVDNVWYREVASSTSDQSWELLKDNQVKISESLTKSDMPTAENAPKMSYTAYACQLYKDAGTKFTPAQAWTNAQPTT